VEGRQPHAAAVASDERLDARAHFFRRFVREGDGEDLRWTRMPVADQKRRAAGDDARLAGTSAGEDQQRPAGMKDRFALLRIQRGEEIQNSILP
jgi:hypothetical protein